MRLVGIFIGASILGCCGLLTGCSSAKVQSTQDAPSLELPPPISTPRKSNRRPKPQKSPAKPPDPIQNEPPAARAPSAPIQSANGQVVSVNAALKFIVIDYSLFKVPSPGIRVNLYRQSQKVGEARLTGPAMDTVIAADLIAGEARVGDEVRGN